MDETVPTVAHVPPLKTIRVRREILERNYTPTINVVDIDRGTAPEFLRNPAEFFKRTAVTRGIKKLVVMVLMSLLNIREDVVGGARYRVESKLFVLPSLFGGGKSHALATLYHVLKVIRESRTPEEAANVLAILDKDIADYVVKNWQRFHAAPKIKVVIVHGNESDYAPTPRDNKPIKTIWGYIADKLGNYQLVAVQDQAVVAPSKDQLRTLLNGSNAVILIDEIVQYYGRMAKDERPLVNQFLLALSELLTTEDMQSCAVVITLPFSPETEKLEKAHAEIVDVNVIKRVLERTRGTTIVVTSSEDIASIIRRRIFDEDPAKLAELGRRIGETIVDAVPAVEIRDHLVRRKLVDELEKTYPVHPETIETLRILHQYLSEHFQLTRSPLAILAESLRAVELGCFDWMGHEPHLLMPYHVPVFDDEVLVSNLPSTERDFQRFVSVLRSSVVRESTPLSTSCTVKPIHEQYVDKDYVAVAYAISVYIWLRSLAGRGLVSNKDIYPTTRDVAYAVIDLPVAKDNRWYDAEATLRYLSGKLPHLHVHEDRWYMKWTPRLQELVNRYAEKVTDDEVETVLRNLLDTGFRNVRSELSVLSEAVVFFNEVREEGVVPTIVVYTKSVSDSELAEQIKYTNTLVLVPDTESKIPPDEAKRYGVKAETYWEALRNAIKYYVVCRDKLTEEVLAEEYKADVREEPDLLKKMKQDVSKCEKDYLKYAEVLISKVYKTVKLKREGGIQSVPLKEIVREGQVFKAVEEALSKGSFIHSGMEMDWVLNIARGLLGESAVQDSVVLNNVWTSLLTGGRAEAPVMSLRWFVKNALKPISNFEYAVKIDGKLYWKSVLSSKSEALARVKSGRAGSLTDEEFESIVEEVLSSMKQGRPVVLTKYTSILDEWLENAKRSLRSNEILVFTDGERELTLDALRQLPGYGELIRATYVAYREKIAVQVDIDAPGESEAEAPINVKLNLKAVAPVVERAKLRITAKGAEPAQIEEDVAVPFSRSFELKPEKNAGEVVVTAVVLDEKGSVLGRGERIVRVRRPALVAEEVTLTVRDAKAYLEAGRAVALKAIEISSFEDYYRSLAVSRELGGSITVKAVMDKDRAEVRVEADNLPVDEASQLLPLVIDLTKRFKVRDLRITVHVPEDKASNVEKIRELPDNLRLTLLVKR
ncbi:MAG: DUF499 domain-containing protein [Thermofilaceae archaeon]